MRVRVASTKTIPKASFSPSVRTMNTALGIPWKPSDEAVAGELMLEKNRVQRRLEEARKGERRVLPRETAAKERVIPG